MSQIAHLLAPPSSDAGAEAQNDASSACQFPTAASGDWRVLQTKSRQEKAVADSLAAMGIGHFLPLARHARYYGRRKQIVELPLFPSYVFLRGSLDDAYMADRTKRIARIIPVPNQEELDQELSNLAIALRGGAVLDAHPYLREGMRVVVRCGPFRGMQGIIDRRAKASRLVLQVNMLAKATSMEMDASLVDPIEEDEAFVAIAAARRQ